MAAHRNSRVGHQPHLLTALACPQCDLLQHRPRQPGPLCCARCGTQLAYDQSADPGRDAALALTTLITLGIANIYPILVLDLDGRRQAATVMDGVTSMWLAGRWELALLVLLVAVAIPLTHAVCVLIRSLLLARGNDARLRRWTLWSVRLAPWGMTEVYLLGALVAFVKLNDLATVVVGPALYAFALMSLLTAWAATHTAGVWAHLRGDSHV